ncbi:MAG: hypothetical protein ACKVP2_07485 [Burkholderiales bacterium]
MTILRRPPVQRAVPSLAGTLDAAFPAPRAANDERMTPDVLRRPAARRLLRGSARVKLLRGRPI